tara:strand:+ start:423 stop:761 length:339 start_codon:yes stop_codon:yes gene_type:complete
MINKIIITIMVYTNCLTIKDLKYLDLLDDIKYKYVKDFDDDDDIEVDIEDVNVDDDEHPKHYCHTKFIFTLESSRFKVKISKTIHYNGSSPVALFLCGIVSEEESDEESDDN